MMCPICSSKNLSSPRYGSVPGGGRLAAVRQCKSCGGVIAVRGKQAAAVRR